MESLLYGDVFVTVHEQEESLAFAKETMGEKARNEDEADVFSQFFLAAGGHVLAVLEGLWGTEVPEKVPDDDASVSTAAPSLHDVADTDCAVPGEFCLAKSAETKPVNSTSFSA